jgi:hypothetical protein
MKQTTQLAERKQLTKQLMIYLAKKDEIGLAEIESGLTISDGIEAVQLRKLEQITGRKNIIKAISYLLLRLADNFNVGKSFTPTQAATTASDLFEVFSYESLEDVALMFKYARQGKIGKVNYNLDHQVIFHHWVPEYLELKAQERERVHQRKKSKANSIQDFSWSKDDLKKLNVSKKKWGWREGLEEMDRRMKKKQNAQEIEEARERIEKIKMK